MESSINSQKQNYGDGLAAKTSVRLLRILLVLVAIAIHQSPLRAQVCQAAAPAYPCVDQPKEGANKITGQLTAPGAAVPGAALVHLVIDAIPVMPDQAVSPTGKFSFNVPASLNRFNTITVTQSAPLPLPIPVPSTGPVNVQTAIPNGRVCGKSVNAASAPCLDQPYEGDLEVTGSLVADGAQPPVGAVVSIKINGTTIDGLFGQIDKSKFTFSGLHALSQYDTVEVFESAPAAVGAPPTTGQVAVKVTENTNLKLTIPATSASLDFGHQAMQTASTPQKVNISNATANDVDIYDPSTTVTSNNYAISADSCLNTLPKKTGTCTFSVAFQPFTISLRPGLAERDLIVIVPKTPEARQRYDRLLDRLVEARKGVSEAQIRKDLALQQETKQEKKVREGYLLAPLGVKPRVLQESDDYDAAVRKRDEAFQSIEQEFQVVSLSGVPDHWKYPLTRAVVGVDLSAPSAQAIKQAYFVDFDLLAPLTLPGLGKYKNEDPLENRLWLWFNPRITSLPQATNFSALSTINETGSFLSQESSKGTLGDIQGLDINGGFEIVLVKPRDGIPWWAAYANTQARLSPSLIVGGGMSTPFSTYKTDVVSTVNQSICDAFSLSKPGQPPPVSPPAISNSQGLVCQPGAMSPTIIVTAATPTMSAVTKPNIDFFTPERSRFFRKAYAGFRLKSYFFSRTIKGYCRPRVTRGETMGDCDGLYDIFPGIIDITVGKDEAVTAGHMSTWLFRVEAVYPLPFVPSIHLFASTYTALKGNTPTQPFNFYTINTPVTGSNNDANTFRFGLQPLNRDYFRVGIGVDLIQLFKKQSSGGQPSSTAPAPVSNPAGGTS